MENKRVWTNGHKNVDMPGVGFAQRQSATVIMADRDKITLKSLK